MGDVKAAQPSGSLLSLELTDFKRFKSFILNLSPDSTLTTNLLITGVNNAGKTTLLWAILIFLRVINMCSGSPSQADSIYLRSPLVELLAHPQFKGVLDFSSFLHNQHKHKDYAYLKGRFSSGAEITFKIRGALELKDRSGGFPAKIKFGYATSAFLFSNPHKEIVGCRDILSFGQQNLRNLYHRLPLRAQAAIMAHLHEWFSVTQITEETKEQHPHLLIHEAGGNVQEVALLGAALQKTFAVLILFYSVIQAPEKQKMFLIEDPEVQLQPTLAQCFMRTLCNLAQVNEIQLIVTSQSRNISACFPEIHILELPDPNKE